MPGPVKDARVADPRTRPVAAAAAEWACHHAFTQTAYRARVLREEDPTKLLAKTDKARTAIQNRDTGLSAQERHILIVSNGQRSLDDIVSMLGPATLGPIDRLLREGYLQAVAGERAAEQLRGQG